MIAIVPARGGSKGLPGKNIKPLLGKPMIAYTIEEALKASSVSEVIISTDDEEIKDVALRYGAVCPFMRPAELAADNSMAIDNYNYTLNRLQSERGVGIQEFIVLLPTSPLRVADDIDNAVEIFRQKQADSVISYTELHHPVQWCRYLDEDGRFIPIFDESLENRQVLKPAYLPNGAVYVFKTDLIAGGRYYSDNSFASVMPRSRSIDIDSAEDFLMAEFFLSKRYEK